MIHLNRKTIIRRAVLLAGTACIDLISFLILRRAMHADLTAAVMLSALISALFAFVGYSLMEEAPTADSMPALAQSFALFLRRNLWALCTQIFGMLILCSVWGAREGRSLALLLVLMIPAYVGFSLRNMYSRSFFELTGRLPGHPDDYKKSNAGRRFFLGGFLLSVTVAGIGFAAHGVWPFGDKTVLIVDSLHQYLPFYTDFQQKLESSSSLLYSFSGGLGYNFWSTYAYYLASPWNLLMVFVPMHHVCDFMDFVILLKIGLCGGIFSWYLHQRDTRKRYLPVVFGAAFALSNFVIGYYFNLMWLDSIAVVPLIMLGIERIVRGGNGSLFCKALFYGLWCNYYIGFMLCFFSCLYYLLCLVSSERITWECIWKSALKFAWYALLAGGIAALLLIPSYVGLSSSESMQDNHFPSTVRFYTGLAEMMMNHFILMEPINIADTQVGLNAYCSVAAVPLALLYLFQKRKRLRERLAHLALAAFLLLSFSLNILNYIWHGFHIQNGLPNRFAFLYVVVILVMAYDALDDLPGYRLLQVLFAYAVPLGFIGWIWKTGAWEGVLERYQIFGTAGILMVWMMMVLLGKYRLIPDRKGFFSAGLAALIAAEISVNGVYGILQNGGVTRSLYLSDQFSWKRLMSAQNDDTFYRSEVDRSRMRNVTMFVGGKGMVMFNSTMQQSVIDLCDSIGIEARTNKNGYLGVTKLFNDVFGIKYMASPSSLGDSMYQFRRLGEDGELTLFKNDNALSVGFVVKDTISDWDIHQTEPLDVQNDFVTLATGHEPIYVLDRLIDMEDGENYGIKIPENKQVYLCLDTRVAKIELETPEYFKTYNDFTDHLYVINSLQDNRYANFTVTLKSSQNTVQSQVYTCANAEYEEVVNALHKSQLTDVRLTAANRLDGWIDVSEAGTLLLTIPYDKGWTVRVDGNVQDVRVIGGALMGVPIEVGEHQVELFYRSPGLGIGTVISLLSLILYLITGVLASRWKLVEVFNGAAVEEQGLPDEETMTRELTAAETGAKDNEAHIRTEPTADPSAEEEELREELLEDEASMDAYKEMMVERSDEERTADSTGEPV